MRQRGAQLQISADPGTGLDRAPARPDPEPSRPTGLLGPGSRRYTSRTFTIDVANDGTAHVKDGRNLRFHLPSIKDLGDHIQGWYEGPKGPSDPGAHEVDFSRPLLAPVGSIGVTIATFDVTDWLMRSAGQDPYASKKLHVLDATRDERVQIGAKHRHDQLARATELMQGNLDQLWATERDPSERKRSLFALWDECAETGAADMIEAGIAARALVVGVIRSKLPAESPDAFTPDELAMLNTQKQSGVRFAPYE